MTFGARLRRARKEKQLTQKELAVKIKAKHNSISNWENDQNMPDPDTIQNLCWALDVQPNYFFSVDTLHPKNNLDAVPQDSPTLLVQSSDFIISEEEKSIITKFRRLDSRGQAAVLNVLNYEYNSLPGEQAGSSTKEA